MKFLKLFSNKNSAVGERIPSPCAVKYQEEDEVDYFHPVRSVIVTEERFIITSGQTGLNVEEVQ